MQFYNNAMASAIEKNLFVSESDLEVSTTGMVAPVTIAAADAPPRKLRDL